MIILGLDLGSRTVGIAKSDALGMIASMVETYRFKEDDYNDASTYIINYTKSNKIDKIVLGYPKNMNGTIGERGEKSLSFKSLLEEKLNIPIELVDERLSTKQAANIMIESNMNRKKRKKNIDSMAAVVILQSYLDQQI